jgi:hypothetical protein
MGKKITNATTASISIRDFFSNAAKTTSSPYFSQAAKVIASKIEPLKFSLPTADDGIENNLDPSFADNIFLEAITSLEEGRKIEMPENEYSLKELVDSVLEIDNRGTSYWTAATGYGKDARAFDKIGNRHAENIAADAIDVATRTESDSLYALAKRIVRNFIDSDIRLYEVFLRLRKSYLAITEDPCFVEEAFVPYLAFAKRFDPYRADGCEFIDYRDFPTKINRFSIRERLL